MKHIRPSDKRSKIAQIEMTKDVKVRNSMAILGAVLKHENETVNRGHAISIPTPSLSTLFWQDTRIQPSEPLTVIQDLSHELSDLLCIPSCSTELLPESIRLLINKGHVLWQGFSKAVLQLSDNVVVKIGLNIDTDEQFLLQYLIHHVPEIPVPKPLGIAQAGNMTCSFMTYIPGDTLENRWPHLTTEQKRSLALELDRILSLLRKLPHESGVPLGSLSRSHLFKDTRASRRVSTNSFATLSACHDWMLSDPRDRISPSYTRWLRTLLKDDFKIVLTHGDLHPRNIMVKKDDTGNFSISGVVDWEMGGWYPEYWEELKALNTRGTDDDSDWWDSIPDSITGYSELVAVHHLIEKATN